MGQIDKKKVVTSCNATSYHFLLVSKTRTMCGYYMYLTE